MNSEVKPEGFDVKVSVFHLKIGMFVTRLDRDWLETPFLTQGFYIRTASDIEQVSQYCRSVWVLGKQQAMIMEKVDFSSGVLIGRKPVDYPIEVDVKIEYQKVKNIFAEATGFIRSMLDDARLGKAVDTANARLMVNKCVSSIIRHPDALSWMVRMRGEDEYTAEHCMNVCILAIVFGRKLGLKKQHLSNLGLCGLLHDLGKMKIPPNILNKPGAHSEEEREVMRQHAELGKAMLSENRGMYEGAIDVAFSHHERPDGLGYPRGIGEDGMTLFSKIISIVDAYDAITGDRVYARGKPSTAALRIIYEARGKQFDHNLALAFIQTIGLYPPGSLVELVNGKVGLVFESDNVYRHLPRVLILLDAQKAPCEHVVVDLSLTQHGELDKGHFISQLLPDGSYGIYLRECFERGDLSLL